MNLYCPRGSRIQLKVYPTTVTVPAVTVRRLDSIGKEDVPMDTWVVVDISVELHVSVSLLVVSLLAIRSRRAKRRKRRRKH